MKKQLHRHRVNPNFILANQQILHSFRDALQDFTLKYAQPTSTITPAEDCRDYLIIDNDTGEIIKA